MSIEEVNSDDSDLLKSTWKQEQAAFEVLKSLKTDHESFTKALLQKVFVDDIKNLCKMEELWTLRQKPSSLPIPSEIVAQNCEDDQKVCSQGESISLFASACQKLLERGETEIVFDKDDADALDFVVAAANLRAACFGIELKSRFDIKAIAGNIIPAIASTNAIAAAMMIVHASNLLQEGREQNYCNAFINYGGGRRNVFTCEQLCPPSPSCLVCGVDRVQLTCNVKELKISDILSSVLPRYPIPFEAEDVSLLEGSRLLYDIDDDAGNSQKTLSQLGVEDSRFLRVDFYGQKALMLAIIDDSSKSGSEFELSDFDLDPNRSVPKAKETEESADNESDLEIVDDLEIEFVTKRVKTE